MASLNEAVGPVIVPYVLQHVGDRVIELAQLRKEQVQTCFLYRILRYVNLELIRTNRTTTLQHTLRQLDSEIGPAKETNPANAATLIAKRKYTHVKQLASKLSRYQALNK